jgi:hypothetical protein
MIRYIIPPTLEAYTQADGILRFNEDGSQSSIPCSLDNTDWVVYLAWLADGNQPETIDE